MNEISKTYAKALEVLMGYANRLYIDNKQSLKEEELETLKKCNYQIELFSKAFNIYLNKCVDTQGIVNMRYAKDYNTFYATESNKLTDEEFEILKEMIG